MKSIVVKDRIQDELKEVYCRLIIGIVQHNYDGLATIVEPALLQVLAADMYKQVYVNHNSFQLKKHEHIKQMDSNQNMEKDKDKDLDLDNLIKKSDIDIEVLGKYKVYGVNIDRSLNKNTNDYSVEISNDSICFISPHLQTNWDGNDESSNINFRGGVKSRQLNAPVIAPSPELLHLDTHQILLQILSMSKKKDINTNEIGIGVQIHQNKINQTNFGQISQQQQQLHKEILKNSKFMKYVKTVLDKDIKDVFYYQNSKIATPVNIFQDDIQNSKPVDIDLLDVSQLKQLLQTSTIPIEIDSRLSDDIEYLKALTKNYSQSIPDLNKKSLSKTPTLKDLAKYRQLILKDLDLMEYIKLRLPNSYEKMAKRKNKKNEDYSHSDDTPQIQKKKLKLSFLRNLKIGDWIRNRLEKRQHKNRNKTQATAKELLEKGPYIEITDFKVITNNYLQVFTNSGKNYLDDEYQYSEFVKDFFQVQNKEPEYYTGAMSSHKKQNKIDGLWNYNQSMKNQDESKSIYRISSIEPNEYDIHDPFYQQIHFIRVEKWKKFHSSKLGIRLKGTQNVDSEENIYSKDSNLSSLVITDLDFTLSGNPHTKALSYI